MSTQSPFGGRTAQAFPTLPRGDVLGTYDSYPEAQRVVAKLAEADFPVAKLAIVGNDLKTVERVTGKMTYGRAALAGALSGLWLGFFFGIVLTLFSPSAGGLFAAAAVIGAGFGMLYGIVSFAITKRQRDFTSVHQVLATNYQIVVEPQLSGEAQRILGQAGAIQHTAWDQPGAGNPKQGGQPGQYGQQGQVGQQGQQGQYGQQGQVGQQPWRPGAGPGGAPQGGPGQGAPTQGRAPQYGEYGQQGQQGQQGSPYGGHATPHQQPGTGQQAAPTPDGRPRYGTNDGPRYGTDDDSTRRAPADDARRGSTGGPRYGTNDGAARDASGDRGANPPQRPEGSAQYGTNDGPRYGERTAAPESEAQTGERATDDTDQARREDERRD
ncbi:hypothetical protein DEJ33_09120 [Curtobacterium sp. MCPF17_047]|uniref:general stress protein n=1 Tax=unclassified Curtobacterium TaxID=257496 RepID=UPI000DAA138A|nr:MULTISPECIES: general stress protein [unclassified Curtobacterium]PZE58019.1 hypothetical protein DEJ24_10850 [Curtobacterium sp. MCPF17_001]PZF65888.1 hypothetical protein DEJ33_09120 [Curtobacterium sp. MCPF17_047]